MKKLFTLLFAVAASVGMMFAGNPCGENLTWTISNNKLIISGTGDMDNYSYSSKAPWYYDHSYITEIVIEEGVTSIGDYAFYDCSKLTSEIIPSNVKRVGNNAYASCSALTSITIQEGVESIGDEVFDYCRKLKTVYLPGTLTSIGTQPFRSCDALGYISVIQESSMVSIVDGALLFDNQTQLIKYPAASRASSYAIPEGVKYIKEYAFANASYLTSITIPNSVEAIADFAFSGCYNLPVVDNVRYAGAYAFDVIDKEITSCTIQEGTKWIGIWTFKDCKKLTSVTLPEGLISIGEQAFERCEKLKTINIPNSVTHIGYSAFMDCNSLPLTDNIRYADTYLVSANVKTLSSYTIKEGTKWIGSNAFFNCSTMTSIVIPEGVQSIESYAFSYCTKLRSITIPESVKHIGVNAFSNVGNDWDTHYNISSIAAWCNIEFDGCPTEGSHTGLRLYINGQQVTDLVIPEGITKISQYAFYCCGIQSVEIPNTVESIGRYAFYECSIKSLSIPNGVTEIGERAFYYNDITSVEIPESVTNIGASAFGGNRKMVSINVAEDNPAYCSIDGMLFNKAATTLIQYPTSNSATVCEIPRSVTKIEGGAFYNCDNLKEIYCYPTNPPTITSNTFSYNYKTYDQLNYTIYVPTGSLDKYLSAEYWKELIIKRFCEVDTLLAPTGVTLTFSHNIWGKSNNYIASCAIINGETFTGNVVEFTGLEPNTEYKDTMVVLTSNTGEKDTLYLSFTTTALELKTLKSKPVSSSTAILLAETNISDAEISCGFEYKRNDAPADMDGTQVYCPVSNGTMAGRLKNLKDDVYYKYRALYQSAKGNVYYGDWQYIFTGDVSVEFDPVLYTYEAVAVTESAATLKGYAIAGAEDFTEQGFEYWAESRVPQANNAPARMLAALGEHKTVQATGIKMQVTLTDLDAGTVYKYRTYAKVGNQVCFGSEMTFTTKGEYQGEEGIELIPATSDTTSRKILYNGQLLILRGDKVYTITGQEVR